MFVLAFFPDVSENGTFKEIAVNEKFSLAILESMEDKALSHTSY